MVFYMVNRELPSKRKEDVGLYPILCDIDWKAEWVRIRTCVEGLLYIHTTTSVYAAANMRSRNLKGWFYQKYIK